MFSGPGHTINPSSVSRMSHVAAGRRSSEWGRSRRKSTDSVGGQSARPTLRRQGTSSSSVFARSEDGNEIEDVDAISDEEAYDAASHRRGRPSQHRKRSRSHTPPRSVFDNLASLFGGSKGPETPTHGRRPSLSNRSSASSRRSRRSVAASEASEDEGDERWGYSSGEDGFSSDEEGLRDDISVGESMRNDSDPPSPSGFLPFTGDPVFGDESRIDMEVPFEPLDPPQAGPPSRQDIYLADEDHTIRFTGYECSTWRQWGWTSACVLSLGILGLLGHWFPRLWLRWTAKEKAFKHLRNGFIVVETSFSDISICPIQISSYPYDPSTVFPPLGGSRSTNGTNGRPHSRRPSISSLLNSQTGSGNLKELISVDYRYTRYAVNPQDGLFAMVREWRDQSWTGASAVQAGLGEDVVRQRRILFGNNEIDIQSKSTISLLVDEIIHPFYVFQIASIILWTIDDYYYYAFCIAVISIFSIGTTLLDTKKTIARMREMSRFSCKVVVYRDGKWQDSDSPTLVPGDVIRISDCQLSVVPADMYLLSGDAIVNESMLTGESIPVTKTPVRDDLLARWKDSKEIVSSEAGKSFLYAGTKIVRIRAALAADGRPGRPALALVTRTGFNTTKGALVRSMLFPKPMGFKFYRDSMRFIAFLAGIAGLGFCASAVQFVRLGVPWHTIILRALDLITVVVPPALPATLSIGTSFAISRLRKLGIYCISPSRVNVGGKVNVCCFDKTGTLTEDGLDILGVRAPSRTHPEFGELMEDVYDIPQNPGKGKAVENPNANASFLHALATCHSLKMVDGEVIGDPLDVKMFEFTKWTLEEGRVSGTGAIKSRSGEVVEQAALVQVVVRPPGSAEFRLEDALRGEAKHAHFLELGVIRSFEFVSALRRMSVVVKRLKSKAMEIYVKGAPEVMADICDKNSFPHDYEDLLSYYTKRGYRVIAIAGKSIEGLTWIKAQKLKREQAESNLQFLGLIIFENKLKPGTAPAIQALRSAHLACRMITGDNPLTAVSVARECGLINAAANVFSPAFTIGNSMISESKLEWASMDDPGWTLDSYSLKPGPGLLHESDDLEYQDYSLVITGDVFRWMINNAPLETLQRMLVKTQIFARMSPDEKNEIVERLQSLGYTVLMCGDGANDCAALKAADVGISLSEAEASVAAPFTSATPDIGCVLEVIREGRASLVTSFSCFKYMALYSMIQFTTITLLYSFASSLGDFQFLYIDLFIIIPVAVTMGRTLPYPQIHPKRPTASLVSKKVLASIIGQIFITSAAQVCVFIWVRAQDWYVPSRPSEADADDGKLDANNYENSVLFLVSCFQYILVAGVFSIGRPYRKPMWTNGWLMTSLVVLTVFNILVLISPPAGVASLLELMDLPTSARAILLAVALVNVGVSSVFEEWGTESVAVGIGALMKGISRLSTKRRVRDGKAYKAIE